MFLHLSVSHSVLRGVFAPVYAGIHSPRLATLPQQMATAADGTHPTGMHSCFALMSFENNF